MKQLTSIFVIIGLFSCNSTKTLTLEKTDKIAVNNVLDEWHLAAAETKFDTYFNLMTKDAIFIGTDATENWNVEDFKTFSKPYFDKGKAWNFKALERHVFINKEQNLAWFDEILDTQMELCRGSGVLVKIKNKWKIKHYVLSLTVPNKNVSELIKLKKVTDSILKETRFNK